MPDIFDKIADGDIFDKVDSLSETHRTKGPGFLGTLQRPDGMVSTELSIGVNFGGKEIEIPSLVPTLSKQEIDHLLNGKEPTKSIITKAIDHARKRINEGKSPFAQVSEVPSILKEATSYKAKPIPSAPGAEPSHVPSSDVPYLMGEAGKAVGNYLLQGLTEPIRKTIDAAKRGEVDYENTLFATAMGIGAGWKGRGKGPYEIGQISMNSQKGKAITGSIAPSAIQKSYSEIVAQRREGSWIPIADLRDHLGISQDEMTNLIKNNPKQFLTSKGDWSFADEHMRSGAVQLHTGTESQELLVKVVQPQQLEIP